MATGKIARISSQIRSNQLLPSDVRQNGCEGSQKQRLDARANLSQRDWSSLSSMKASRNSPLHNAEQWQPSQRVQKRQDQFASHVPRAQVETVAAPSVEQTDKLVAQVKEKLLKEHSDLPVGRYGRDDDELLLWFLKDRKFNVDAAAAKLAVMIKWRNEFGVQDLTAASVAKEAATGKAYLHTSPDVKGRPVVIVRASRHIPEDLLESQKLCVFLIEEALQKLPPGGDQFLGVFDLREFKTQNTDWAFIKFLIDVFFNYYPKRLGQVLFVDAPFIFKTGWELIRPMLKSYAQLVRFCSEEDVRNEYFMEDTIPKDFKKV